MTTDWEALPVCSVDWGLVVNSIAAIGSVGAALIALHIATRDRKERRRERQAAQETQASLIQFMIRTARYDNWLHVDVKNYGQWAVLDMVLVDALLVTPTDRFFLADPIQNRAIPVVPTIDHATGEETYAFHMRNADGELWQEGGGYSTALFVHVRVQCRTADGQAWLISNQNAPERMKPIPTAKWYRTIWWNVFRRRLFRAKFWRRVLWGQSSL